MRPAAERLPFTAVYHMVAFKEAEANVFLSSPVTAKFLEVERFTKNQDRFNVTAQRSVNKVPRPPSWFWVLNVKLFGGVTGQVRLLSSI